MSLLSTIRNAIGSWRKRVTNRGRQRATVALEQLDHRRLLAVNFTGNALADIPDTTAPGTAIVQSNTTVPINNPQLAQLIKVSGFDISAIRMKYTPQDDTVSVAIQQPSNQRGQGNLLPLAPVIAGDADNNGDGGTVSLAVKQIQPLFQDYPNLGGSETMAVFFDFNNDGVPDVVAGVPNTPGAGKFFVVADAVPNPTSPTTSAPSFGTPLPANTGYAYLRDTDPTAGAFEFQITNFSKLYQSKTGTPLTTASIMRVGGFAGSPDDFIDEEFVPAQPINFGVVPKPDTCPPLSPSIFVNSHAQRIINTSSSKLVRVYIIGSSGFEVDRILPDSVTLAGAPAVGHFKRNFNRDEFPDATYLFRANQINLPPGVQLATLSGQYVYDDQGSVTQFSSSQLVRVVGGPGSASTTEFASQSLPVSPRSLPANPGAPRASLRSTSADGSVSVAKLPASVPAPGTSEAQLTTRGVRPTVAVPTRKTVSIPLNQTAALKQSGHQVKTVARAASPSPTIPRGPVASPIATPQPVSRQVLVDTALGSMTAAPSLKVNARAIDELAANLSR